VGLRRGIIHVIGPQPPSLKPPYERRCRCRSERTASYPLGVKFGPRLPRSFFDRPSTLVGPELIGAVLVHELPGGVRLAARIVEVEAYLGQGRDAASHAHRGVTQRNRSMFEAPGRIYAYRSYGIHTCFNAVCEPAGSASAVLLRAAEPLLGLEEMRRRRGLLPGPSPASASELRKIASGPGRLAQALGIGLEHDGASLLRGPMTLRAPGDRSGSESWPLPPSQIEAGPRVGITRDADLPYRFSWKEHPLVSPWRPGKSRRPPSR
jgi:DNA-3-methyladenine glycosylase